jgi:DNA-binding MarR family transcriptional regulator
MQEDAIDQIVQQWNRARPHLDVSVTHVLQRISRLYLLQSASFAAVFDRYGITFGEFEVLAALLRSGPPFQMSPTQLVDAVVLSSGAMTNRIDRVEALGMVKRLPDPDDRRGTFVVLTREGRQTVDAAVVAHLANEERLLGALSSAERGTLSRLLRKLLLSEPFAAVDSGRTIDQSARTTRRRRVQHGLTTRQASSSKPPDKHLEAAVATVTTRVRPRRPKSAEAADA